MYNFQIGLECTGMFAVCVQGNINLIILINSLLVTHVLFF